MIDNINFVAGNCTWGVAMVKGGVNWAGNGKDWLANAQAAGIATGSTPQVGAIVVFPAHPINGGYGHVGLVTKQDPASGEWCMASMNDVHGLNKWTERPVRCYANSKNRITPVGYIYFKQEKCSPTSPATWMTCGK